MTQPSFNHKPAQQLFKTAVEHAPLGKSTAIPTSYSPQSLVAIKRESFHLLNNTCFGTDIFNCYELYLLNPRYVPQVAIAELSYPAHSPNIVESKSLKLYLNSLNTKTFTNQHAVIATIKQDLESIIQSPVAIKLTSAHDSFKSPPHIRCIDSDIDTIQGLSQLKFLDHEEDSTICTHCFRSLCPVTGQPDFATIVVSYKGQHCTDQSLFEYFISFNQHQHFHEQCIDQIFEFLTSHIQFKSVTVQGLFTRRGGIDIYPIRSTDISFSSFARPIRC